MKTKMIAIIALLAFGINANAQDKTTEPGKKVLIAYFSWGGNTQYVAEHIAALTGGALFRIEIGKTYPTEYKPCTEVAKVEVDKGIRPPLKSKVDNLEQYDTIFVGCPVWWHTAPMAIWTFLESKNYNFKGKTIVPFCTYAATYRDETLAKIVELTPDSRHLKGFGAVDRDTKGVEAWLKEIKVLN